MAKLITAQGAAAKIRELLADLGARGLARRPALDQRAAGAEHLSLHARDLAAEHLGHLGMRQPGRLGQEERSALLLGQLAHVGEQLPQLGALLHLFAEASVGTSWSSAASSRRARSTDTQRLRAIV